MSDELHTYDAKIILEGIPLQGSFKHRSTDIRELERHFFEQLCLRKEITITRRKPHLESSDLQP